jgi:hypothetical protein
MRRPQLRLLNARRERRAWLRAGADPAARFAAATSATEVAKLLVDDVAPGLGAISSVLYLVDARRTTLRRRAVRAERAEALACPLSIPVDCHCPLATAARTGRAYWFRDRAALLAEPADEHRLLAGEKVTALAVLPLSAGGRVLGVFKVAFDELRAFTDEDLEELLVAAEAAARALVRCRSRPTPTAVPSDDAGPLRFQRLDGSPLPLCRELAVPVELGRLLRESARRLLPGLRPEGRGLTCETERLLGRWAREWLERTVTAVLWLARELADGDLTIEARGEEDCFAIEVLCAPRAKPSARGRIDLAALTRAREAWMAQLWLCRGMARTGGARLSLLEDGNAPTGLRLELPVSVTFPAGD